MAIGDDAVAKGMPLVPETGSVDALVRYGARELNRTRDFIANTRDLIPTAGQLGLTGVHTISSANPSGGSDGDVWFKYTP